MKKLFALLILLLTGFVLAQTGTLTAADVGLPEPNPNSIEVVDITDECRIIRDFQGESCVPLNPIRIVSMDPGTITDNLLALGQKPVASRTYEELSEGLEAAFPAAIAGFAEGIEGVGTWPPNIESVLAAAPDLIITYDWMFDQIPYDQFAAIAPTVAIQDTNDWRSTLVDIARIIGDEETAQQLIDQFYVDAAALDAQLPDMDIALLRPRPDLMQIYGTSAEATRILDAIGLSLTPVPPGATNLWGEDGQEAGQISYEVLDLIEGEVFFVIGYNLEPDQMAELMAGDVWNALPVVAAGNAFNVPGFAWTNHGYYGVYKVLEEVEAALLDN
ncbi:MAG: ABC transporter substrate-binding protein [Deinococcota bacterium]